MDVGLIAAVLVFMGLVMGAGWATCRAVNNGGWTDVFWTFGTGAALAATALAPTEGPPNARQWLAAALVAIWSIRLGTFVARRVAGAAEDRRYAQFRAEWGAAYDRRMAWITLIQAPASTLLAMSVYVAAHRPEPGLTVRDLAAAAVLLIAIAGESLADAQMNAFRKDPANRGQVARTGLWAWSRHPNYFFEWTTWLAWPLMAFEPARAVSWLTLIAPVVMYLVLTRGSGIPPLEAVMLKSRGEAYRRYQAQVSAFFPLPPKSAP